MTTIWKNLRFGVQQIGLLLSSLFVAVGIAEDNATSLPRAFVDGTGLGWVTLGEQDFVHVNCDPDTWSWKDGVTHCTGKPTGVIRSQKLYTNFELVVQWRH